MYVCMYVCMYSFIFHCLTLICSERKKSTATKTISDYFSCTHRSNIFHRFQPGYIILLILIIWD